MLHGRAAELGGIHDLLANARAGHSSMLVLQGEAGSGKTALLEHVAADAKDFRVLRCTGVESEAELPFAALHLLLLDCLERLDALPAPQAAALKAAFGLAEAPGVDRLLAGLATLTLLSEVAADSPLLCLIDDAHWLDRASRDALLFAGRRLGAEGVVLLLAMRDNDEVTDLRDVRVVPLSGLSQSAAAALLAEQAADLTPDLRDRLIEEADRITAHRALADALPEYADRRAWHLAAAAGGFDDEAADAMEAAVLRAEGRGGYAASAAAYERSARLTADPVVRARRLAAAATGARDSAQLDRAAELAHEASALTDDSTTLARLAWVRARLEFERGTPRHASEMVLAGAATVYGVDIEEAARMLIEVVRMAYFADEAPGLVRAAELIDALPLPAGHPLRPMLAQR